MALPKAVEEQGRRSDELLAKAQEAKNKPPENQPAEPKPGDPPADPPPNNPKPDDVKDWKQLYDELKQSHAVLQGKYNAEVPRLHREKRELQDQLTRVNDEVSSLKAEVGNLKNQLEQKPAPQAAPTEKLQKAVEQYGEDNLLVGALSEQNQVIAEQRDLISSLNSTINQLNAQLSDIKTSTERERADARAKTEEEFFTKLSEKVPDWDAINDKDAGWHEYLAKKDKFSGRTRQQLLDDARDSLDVERVIEFFNDYKQLRDSNKPETMDDNLGDIAQPDTKSGADGGGKGDKKIWTRAEIKQFYSDNARGKYTKEEAQEFERDILAAQTENRIR